MTSKRKPARSSAILDQWRAKALQGDPLRHLPDADREWVFRSLLKGRRLDQAVKLAKLRPEQIEPALERVRKWYRQRCETYKRQQAAQQTPRVVRPVVAAPTLPARGWWPFGKR